MPEPKGFSNGNKDIQAPGCSSHEPHASWHNPKSPWPSHHYLQPTLQPINQGHLSLALPSTASATPGSFAGDNTTTGKYLMFPESEYPQILVSVMHSEAEYTLGWHLALVFWKGEEGSVGF